jgi:hypothetical protein
MKIHAPVKRLLTLISKEMEGEKININALRELGCYILRNGMDQEITNKYLNECRESISKKKIVRTAHHKTEIKVDQIDTLMALKHDSNIAEIASEIFPNGAGCDFIRIVKKDSTNRDSVFLHQDTGYQVGQFEAYSLFIALTQCDLTNGGLVLYPGTHHFGYLGDAGEIRNILPADYPFVESKLFPGDILIMHSGLWHKSPENVSGADRIYLEIHIRDVNDPFSRWEISGHRSCDYKLDATVEEIFRDSRSQRLKKFYNSN